MGVYQFEKEQFIPTTVDVLWDFISSPKNLAKITPKHMGFKITSKYTEEMYEGMIISYKVSPFKGYTTTWVTEITHVKPKTYFVDEQRVGPYKMWHHQHILIPKEKGVLMKDIITYKPPYGFLGTIANSILIKKQLEQIFNYRKEILNNYFPN